MASAIERGFVWCVSQLTKLHPADFRRLLGDEMVTLIEHELRDTRRQQGVLPMIRCGISTTAQVVRAALAGRARHAFRTRDSPRMESVLSSTFSELRQSLRTLRHRPGFALVAILTFALGIGGATAVFSVFEHVLLEPLPFNEPAQLVQLWETRGDDRERNFSIPNFETVRERTRTLQALGAYMFGDFPSVTLTGGDEPERIAGAMVTPELFDLLGIHPAMGRTFTAAESQPDHAAVVILGHELWMNRFAGDPGILGSPLMLNHVEHLVVGIMPPGTDFPVDSGARLWRPLPYLDSWKDRRSNRLLRVIARLEPGVAVAAANEELDALGATLATEFPDTNADGGMRAVALHQQVVGDVRVALYALSGGIMLVWLVTMANLVSLGISRVLDRSSELSVRRALGASRAQIIRVVAAETAVLAVVGSACGLGVARLGVTALAATGPTSIPRLASASVDLRAVGFAVILAAITALAAGVFPGLATSGAAPSSLIGGQRSFTGGRRGTAIRSFLVVAEFGLALALVVGAMLLFQSLDNLLGVDPGFRVNGTLTAELNLPGARYPSGASRVQFYDELMPALTRLPGVTAATAVNVFPLTGNPGGATLLHSEGATQNQRFAPSVRFRVVLPNYFETIELPVVSGRPFTADDDGEHPVAIVNQTLAATLWPGEEPVGKPMFTGEPGDPRRTYEVVGVVADAYDDTLSAAPRPHIFVPYPQFRMQEMVLVLTTEGPPAEVAAELRAAVLRVDPDQPVESIATMEDIVASSVAQPRFLLTLLGTFAAIAVALSAVGVYGVTSSAVMARTRELGIRVALGADRARLLRLTMRQGVRQTVAGVAAGCTLAVAGAGLLDTLLFGVSPRDPRVFITASATLGAIALLAALVPAFRAARVDPVTALSSD